ncbi:MAG: F0F1 ATP synthase subunit epsilon [Ktedonobacterales bacterium]
MAQRRTLHVRVVTAQQTVFQGEADMVIAPGSEGQLGILPEHAPLLTTLALGEMRIRHGGVDESLFVAGGFLEVNTDVVTVLADDAQRAEEIDVGHAEEARRRAEAILAQQGITADAESSAAGELERAIGRIKVAELHSNRIGTRRRPPREREVVQ